MSKRGELDAGLLYQDTEVFKEFTYEDLGLGQRLPLLVGL